MALRWYCEEGVTRSIHTIVNKKYIYICQIISKTRQLLWIFGVFVFSKDTLLYLGKKIIVVLVIGNIQNLESESFTIKITHTTIIGINILNNKDFRRIS